MTHSPPDPQPAAALPHEGSSREWRNRRPWLSELLSRLTADVRYATLRVTPELLADGSEVDILVHPGDMQKLIAEVRSTCRSTPGLWCLQAKLLGSSSASIVLVERTSDGSLRPLRLDIRSGIRKKGDLIVDATQVMPARLVVDAEIGAVRLDEHLEAALLLLRNAVDGRPLLPRHQEILGRADPGRVADEVRSLGFDPDAAAEGTAVRIRRQSVSASARFAVRSALGRLRAGASGRNVVLYGPDGVGKTTQQRMLATRLTTLGIRPSAVLAYHAFVPAADVRDHERRASTGVKVAAVRSSSRGTWQAALMAAAWARRVIHYLRALRPELRRGCFIVHDRYFFDVALKAHKASGTRSRLFEQVLSRLVPRGDIIFVLRADPTVASRTGEISPEATAEAYAILDACIAASGLRSNEIDAMRPQDIVADDLLMVLLDHQTATFARD